MQIITIWPGQCGQFQPTFPLTGMSFSGSNAHTNTVAAAILLPKFGSTLDCIGGEGLCSQEGFVGASVLCVGEWMLLPVCLGISHGCDFRGSYSLSHGFPAVFWLKVDGNL